jgi:predicted ArsR family transcriptional regulator
LSKKLSFALSCWICSDYFPSNYLRYSDIVLNVATGHTKQRVIEHLQVVQSSTAPEMARLCAVTDAAMRQHLEQLEAEGLVCRSNQPSTGPTRGRPAVHWVLNPDKQQSISESFPETFPDRHHDLAVDLLVGINESLGPDALHTVLTRRGERLASHYQTLVAGLPLAERVSRLATARDAEGYRAEASTDADGSHVLTEHHCAIAEAAAACAGLCESELVVFRTALGPDTTVERIQFAPAGDGRCSYRISPR